MPAPPPLLTEPGPHTEAQGLSIPRAREQGPGGRSQGLWVGTEGPEEDGQRRGPAGLEGGDPHVNVGSRGAGRLDGHTP